MIVLGTADTADQALGAAPKSADATTAIYCLCSPWPSHSGRPRAVWPASWVCGACSGALRRSCCLRWSSSAGTGDELPLTSAWQDDLSSMVV